MKYLTLILTTLVVAVALAGCPVTPTAPVPPATAPITAEAPLPVQQRDDRIPYDLQDVKLLLDYAEGGSTKPSELDAKFSPIWGAIVLDRKQYGKYLSSQMNGALPDGVGIVQNDTKTQTPTVSVGVVAKAYQHGPWFVMELAGGVLDRVYASDASSSTSLRRDIKVAKERRQMDGVVKVMDEEKGTITIEFQKADPRLFTPGQSVHLKLKEVGGS